MTVPVTRSTPLSAVLAAVGWRRGDDRWPRVVIDETGTSREALDRLAAEESGWSRCGGGGVD